MLAKTYHSIKIKFCQVVGNGLVWPTRLARPKKNFTLQKMPTLPSQKNYFLNGKIFHASLKQPVAWPTPKISYTYPK